MRQKCKNDEKGGEVDEEGEGENEKTTHCNFMAHFATTDLHRHPHTQTAHKTANEFFPILMHVISYDIMHTPHTHDPTCFLVQNSPLSLHSLVSRATDVARI